MIAAKLSLIAGCRLLALLGELFSHMSTIQLFLLDFVLLGQVLLNELTDEVAICSMPVGHSAEPVALKGTVLDLLLGHQSLAIRRDLRNKDRILVDL